MKPPRRDRIRTKLYGPEGLFFQTYVRLYEGLGEITQVKNICVGLDFVGVKKWTRDKTTQRAHTYIYWQLRIDELYWRPQVSFDENNVTHVKLTCPRGRQMPTFRQRTPKC